MNSKGGLPNGGKGRPAGTRNHITRDLRDMVIGALEDCGGRAYLAARARDKRTQAAFLALVGRCVPQQLRVRNEGNPATWSDAELMARIEAAQAIIDASRSAAIASAKP